jgi:predicted PurR-regulated permease PerM
MPTSLRESDLTLPALRPAAAPVALPSATHIVILAAVIVSALYVGSSVFIPLALAVLLSFVLSPLVVALRKLRLPRSAAVGVVVLAVVVVIAGLALAMARQVTDLANDLPRYQVTLREKLKSLRTGMAQSSIIDRATSTLSELGKELDGRAPQKAPATAEPDPSRPIPVEVHQPPERPLDTFQRVVSALIAPLTTTGIVLILVVFILLQREDIRDRAIRLLGGHDLELTTAALNDAASRLSRLFLMQMILNAAFGVVVAIGLWIIGVPSPILWGGTAALMRFIPYVGALLSAVFPVLLATAVDPGWTMMLSTLALFLVLEPLVGHVIEPMVQGHSTGLSPLAVVVSAFAWTAMWGPIGLLLATPLTICLVVLGRHVDGLAFLAVLLGDQPALTPPQTFYQRLLSGASAEAIDQAESVLKKSSLAAYYDDVALEGLKLAATDAQRGTLDGERMETLREGLSVILEDLADEPIVPKVAEDDDTEPAPKRADPKIAAISRDDALASASKDGTVATLCLGVRTPLDAAAADILAQSLQQYGVASRAASVVNLSDLGKLELDDIRLVWLSAFDSARSQAHLRYVARRLKRRSPNILLGGAFWNGGAADGIADDDLAAHRLEEAARMTLALAGLPQPPSTQPARDEGPHPVKKSAGNHKRKAPPADLPRAG